MGKTAAEKSAPVSERERFWLKHHEAQAASGKTAKEYAAEQGLSLHAFYQGRKRLRALGLLPAARGKKDAPVVSSSARSSPARFSRVSVATPIAEPARFRIELANGSALEWIGPVCLDSIDALLERMACLP